MTVAGSNFAGRGQNAGMAFVRLRDWKLRNRPDLKVGAVAGKLHTGRSRNDQVATDTRLWLRGAIDGIALEVRALQQALADTAARELDGPTVMPGQRGGSPTAAARAACH